MKNEPFIDFQGKNVLVTGASSGIGRAISIELSRRGAGLVLSGRDDLRLSETAELLETDNYHILPLELNDHAAISPKIKELSQKIGRIYGLCHSAGIVETRPLSACKVDSLKSMLDVNVIAGIELSRAIFRRGIMEEDGGAILFISSVHSLVGMPGQIGYSASKGAVSAAARSMAIELARRKVRVNTLAPGLVRTHMTNKALSMLSEQQVKNIEDAHPLGFGNPEDVARAAVFLLSPQSSWITGSELVIDGGYTAR